MADSTPSLPPETVDVVPPVAAPPPVEAPVVAPPVVVAAPVAEPPVRSWQTVLDRARTLDPVLAEDIGKLHGQQSNEAGELRRKAQAAPAIDPFSTIIARRHAGLEEGDPYEGIEFAAPTAPDFAALVGDIPDEALTDRAALQAAFVGIAGKLWAAATGAATDIARDTVTKASRAAYAPVVQMTEQRRLEEEERAGQAVVRKLPGMVDDAAFNKVYDELETEHATSGLRGIDGFRAVYARMLPDHPEWMAPKAAAPAPAAPAPEVIVRTPAPVRPAMSDADRLAMQALGVKGVNGGGLPTLIPKGLSPTEKTQALTRSPEWQALLADPNATDADRRRVRRQLTGDAV